MPDRSITRPIGLLEDILVRVGAIVVPVDFYVLDMGDGSAKGSTLIFGRLFLMTTKYIMNMKEGLVSIEVGDQKVTIQIFETLQQDKKFLELNALEAFD